MCRFPILPIEADFHFKLISAKYYASFTIQENLLKLYSLPYEIHMGGYSLVEYNNVKNIEGSTDIGCRLGARFEVNL